MTRRNFLLNAAIAAGATLAGAAGAQTPAPAQKPKTLVAYYSWSGNTKALARHLADALGAELLELTPETPYPTAYSACLDKAKADIAAGARPALKALPDLAPYDAVLVGTPNWWGTLAPPVCTLIENPALAGKKMALFQTHGGGGEQRCGRDFRRLTKGEVVAAPLIVAGTRAAASREAAAKWAAALPL